MMRIPAGFSTSVMLVYIYIYIIKVYTINLKYFRCDVYLTKREWIICWAFHAYAVYYL
jgi:hypothetical protein